MVETMRISILGVFLSIIFNLGSASILDYLPIGRSYFSNNNPEPDNLNGIASQKVPYEVAVVDEKFIEQAAKYTGTSLSELDKCQHRVVLKLQNECHKLNDEDLAKLAVSLLNCQSSVEGRQIFPCTDAMAIRECTANMDSDTWNSYLLMSNRARAVCYSVRQAHFRGLTELTVNKLMNSAQEQLHYMKRLRDGQSKLEDATSHTYEIVIEGNKDLKQQQQDLQAAQFHGQLALEDNIRRLSHEKKLIIEGHQQLSSMTKDIMKKLEFASSQIDNHANEHKDSHVKMLNDLSEIQMQAQAIFLRIEESTQHMLEQSLLAAEQYESTLKQLEQVNATIYSLVEVMANTRSALEEKLGWLSEALGGTDHAVERLYLFLTHITYLILAMVSCAFLQIAVPSRLALVVLVPLNLFVALQQGSENSLSFLGMSGVLVSFIIAHTAFISTLRYWNKMNSKKAAITYKNREATPLKEKAVNVDEENEDTLDAADTSVYRNGFSKPYGWNREHLASVDDFATPTPPLSRNGLSRSRSNTPLLSRSLFEKSKCAATTRMGTPCKMSAVAGREFCFKHQTGTSVIS